jgi:hypothetical protein
MESKEQMKLRKEARNEVLLSKDPEIEVIKSLDVSEELRYVLSETQDFIDASYQMGANPLSHLRKYFPGFAWNLCHPKTVPDLKKVVVSADYTWCGSEALDWSCGLVTATQVNNKGWSRAIYYEGNNSGRFLDYLQGTRARPF